MKFKQSLRLSFSLWTIGSLLLILLPAAYFSISKMNQVRTSFADRYGSERATDIRNRLQQRISSDYTTYFQLAGSPSLIEWLKHENNPLLELNALNLINSFNSKTNLVVYTSRTQNIYPNIQARLSSDSIKYLDFSRITLTNQFALKIDKSSDKEQNLIWLIIPIQDPDLPLGPDIGLGLVAVRLDLAEFFKNLLDIRLGKSLIILCNREGEIIAWPEATSKPRGNIYSLIENQTELKSLSQLIEDFDRVQEGKSQTLSLRLKIGKTRFVASLSKAPLLDWYTIVLFDPDAILSIEKFMPLVGSLLVILIGLFLTMLTFINRRLIHPIVEISSVMIKMMDGNLEIRAGSIYKNEIGDLALACNALADEIKTYTTRLEGMVQSRTQELSVKHNELIESINYAQLIQNGILPSNEEIQNSFPDSAIIWRPQEVVSGNFYWYQVYEDRVFLAVCNCLEHGVPGAFMTMTTKTILDHIIWYINDDPAAILMELDRVLRTTLNKELTEELKSGVGLKVSLVMLNPRERSLTFSGALSPLIYASQGELTVIPGDLQGIVDSNQAQIYAFASHEINYQRDDAIYLASDGALSLGMERLVELLAKNLDQSSQAQAEILGQELEQRQQLDDLTLWLIKLP